MPRIDDQSTIKRPFKKKAYRPWHLLDEFEISSTIEKNSETVSLENKVINKEPLANQKELNSETSSNQQVIENTSIVIQPKSLSNQSSNPISNQEGGGQSKNKPPFFIEMNAHTLIQRVSGLQRKILFYIVEDCILQGTLHSSPITTETLKLLTKADTDTVKTATQRLINKNLISRGHGKKGKGGFAIFFIKEDIRNAVIEAKKNENNPCRLVTNWVSNKEPIVTYSSGSNYIKTTTNENKSKDNFINNTPEIWETVDLDPLVSIGFTKVHLNQIILDDKLSVEMIQDSIYAFAFDLEKNNKQKSLKSAPLNYFMGILRSGKPYAPPANYESPQDTAMRIYLERKQQANAKRQAMEEALFQEAYNEWDSQLEQSNKESLLPNEIRNIRLVSAKIAYLRNYFRENLWPTIKKQFFTEEKNEKIKV